MAKEREIDIILYRLIRTGSKISYLEDLRKDSLYLIGRDRSLSEILTEIGEEIHE